VKCLRWTSYGYRNNFACNDGENVRKQPTNSEESEADGGFGMVNNYTMMRESLSSSGRESG